MRTIEIHTYDALDNVMDHTERGSLAVDASSGHVTGGRVEVKLLKKGTVIGTVVIIITT